MLHFCGKNSYSRCWSLIGLFFIALLLLPGCGAIGGGGGVNSPTAVSNFTPYPPMPDQPTAVSSQKSQVRDSETIDLASGWSTISFPTSEVTSTDAFPYELEYWDGSAYQQVDPSAGLTAEQCKMGFWALTDSAVSVGINTSGQEGAGSVTLLQGWNLIAFPQATAENFSDLTVTLDSDTENLADVSSLDTTAGSQWLYGIIQYYKNNRWYQLKTDNGANQLVPWKGYWVFSWQNGVKLNFEAHQSGPHMQIAAGCYSGYALKPDGTVWAWGANEYGELGNGTNDYKNSPVLVSNLTGVTSIAEGYFVAYALKSDGTVWAWGWNVYGELGNGATYDYSNTPVQVSNLTGITAIAGGGYHGYALKWDGTVWAWGNNWNGELGNGTNNCSSTPVQVSNLTGVTAIAGGGYHGYAIKSDGTVWAWGFNEYGQLGDGATYEYSNTPVQVNNLTGVTAIAGGYYTGYALKSDGTAWAWGNNQYGELGNGACNNSSIPVQVSNLTGVTAITGNLYTGYALKSDGTVWAWGWNVYGALGNGAAYDYSNTPVQVSNLTGVTAITAGGLAGYALKSDSTIWAWGRNASGELGNCSNANSNIPVQVTSF